MLVPFPFTDQPAKSKRRPAIIISNQSLNSIGDIIVAAVTSQSRFDKFSFPLENQDLSNPLPKRSEVRCHKISTLSKNLVIKEFADLDNAKTKELIEKIKGFLEVPSTI